MLGNIELNDGTTNNHMALTSYFANPSLKKTKKGNFVGIFFIIIYKNVFKIVKHHQIKEKLFSFINLEYYLVFQLYFVKKWFVYLKNFY